MALQPIQLNTPNRTNFRQNESAQTYRDANKPVRTSKRVKPLPPKGHLVDDDLVSGTKYFFKDIGYDMKSLKNGYKGTANDHQLGRLNDVGLRLGGIGIATYLASQTTNPKARLMEYIGLAVFLTSMAIYPKIAINTPAKIMHGYDIDKEYIDDQGRKKSVHQDSNYIPYDMYNGNNKGEDLDIIGDRMGIPRDIKNRHDVIKEQMRKIATQNNTLWMLTAGFATPLMTALLCCGIEKFIVSPSLEKARNHKYDAKIQSMLNQVVSEKPDYNIINNSLGDSVKSIITKFEGKVLPPETQEELYELLCKETDVILSDGIKKDIEQILTSENIIRIDEKTLSQTIERAQREIQGRQSKFIIENVLPAQNEIANLIKNIKPEADLNKGVELTLAEFEALKSNILEIANGNIENLTGEASKHKDYLKSNVLKYQKEFKFEQLPIITKESGEKIVKFANILGDFKDKIAVLDKCENFKFEYTPGSILADYYEKFQKTLIKQLDISPKDYKRMSNDKEFTKQLLDKKFAELCKNETKYKQTFEALGKVLSDMETALNGKNESESLVKDLINAIETVYHNAAKALNGTGNGQNTANRLVKSENPNIIKSKEDLYKLLDGVNPLPEFKYGSNAEETLKIFANSKGSSKNLKINRLINRYQGEVDSFFRVLHTLDFYKTALNPETLMSRASAGDTAYIQKLEKEVKEAMLNGSISDFILKNGIENVNSYRDFYNVGWALEPDNVKGKLTSETKAALTNAKEGNISERLQTYITRLRDVISNDKTDFTKPSHTLNENIVKKYSDAAKNNEAKFNLIAQSPVDMAQKAASKMHGDRMWLKSVGIFTGVVFGVTLLAQFFFGKIKNAHNLQKIKTDDNVKQKQVANV